ncbi:PadR family transcriptional regulator [Sphingomonas gilva]|uniref:PadR family transcriptional regulator n=1 Tax=Sphingomonas gilva TaxID=2305907 RepID=A0A396RRP5_9SPHN|nr:PadR family transcriptional regulator [Sphingomonas gilva]RHW16983.1 PadR family transcriptional regulator [Sphingomonas gilva]
MGYDRWAGGGRGGFGAGHGHHGMGHGRGRRRVFDGGELRLVLLKLIADTPRHGYDLIREIEAMTGGAYAPSPGVVYPTLTMLEDMELIAEERSEGAKKMFAATDAGRTHLAEQAEQAEALIARLTDIGRHSARTDGGPVRRAMGNLRTVLQNRLGQGDVDADLLHQASAIIDEAAQKIERLKA